MYSSMGLSKLKNYHYLHLFLPSVSIIKAIELILALLLLSMVNTNAENYLENVNNINANFITGYTSADDEQNVGATHGVAPTIEAINETITEHMTTTASPYHDEYGDDDDESKPSEIQKAVCTVTAGEVKASAEAVTTKVLKGVCGSAEMNLALQNLEIKLLKELQDIKDIIKQHFGLKQVAAATSKISASTEKAKNDIFYELYSKNNPTRAVKENVKSPDIPKIVQNTTRATSPTLKSFPTSHTAVNARDHEVLRFNNTMLSDRELKVFTYYWKLENVSQHIASGASNTLESPIFSIKGKPLHIRAIFHHLQRDFLYLQLSYASVNISSSGNNRNNIILDTGGLFKEIVNDNVLFKYKISILNQNNQRAQDLVSQEFMNLDTGFLVPNSALLTSSYVKNNSILVQIFLYL